MTNFSRVLLSVFAICVLAGCRQEVAKTLTSEPKKSIEKLPSKHLPNLVQVHPQVLSGGSPEGDEAFAELRSRGVRTVISVDGAKPDVATAKRFGLRYVHLPHGYDGVPTDRAAELAKAVLDLPGPIYIHCHHGKHRSPAAAAVACVGAGLIASGDARSVLQLAGTSEHYRGLYDSAAEARHLDQALLNELKADFPAVAKLPAMAEAMVALEHTHDHLKSFQVANWQPLARQPDLESAHEALLLREHYVELQRSVAARAEPAGFQDLLQEGEAAAQELEDALRKPSPVIASRALEKVSANCLACHRTYRDLPLREKLR